MAVGRGNKEKVGKRVMREVPKSARVGSRDGLDAKRARLNRIKGQVEGIERMLEENRYCMDVINQIKAIQSALKGLESQILEAHLRDCVRSAFESKNVFDVEEKIREIIALV